jgi:SOS-response transcriptional repressor LexA
VIFSVNLFNEGVDLPTIDTVLMLRPTESKILFLQQLGRGLRRAPGKERLIVLDFIGNHHSFLHKPQILGQLGSSYHQLANFARELEAGRLELPAGCRLNFELELIDFLKALDRDSSRDDYLALRDGLGHRSTLAEFYRSGVSIDRMRKEYQSWFELVEAMADLDAEETAVLSRHRAMLREFETTAMSDSFKMVLLEAFQEVDGWRQPPRLVELAARSWQILQRRRSLLGDLPDAFAHQEDGNSRAWQDYWRNNPVQSWLGEKQARKSRSYFHLPDERFAARMALKDEEQSALSSMVQEIIDYRFARYEARVRSIAGALGGGEVAPFPSRQEGTELPYFPELRIACGHFRNSSASVESWRSLGSGYGALDPTRHFIARSSGHSMDGGKNPVRDGDYLLLELLSPENAGSITGATLVVERQDRSGDDQYLLRKVSKRQDGSYVLIANNPEYDDIHVSAEMAEELRTLARLKAVIDPLEMAVGEHFMREDIAALFGVEFNPGNWNSGHIILNEQKAHILLVTLNKQGKAADHRYLDRWLGEGKFQWSSQNSTTPLSKRGTEIIEHAQRGISLHLFVREHKLSAGKGAPFCYHGKVRYQSHTGSGPMSVILELA